MIRQRLSRQFKMTRKQEGVVQRRWLAMSQNTPLEGVVVICMRSFHKTRWSVTVATRRSQPATGIRLIPQAACMSLADRTQRSEFEDLSNFLSLVQLYEIRSSVSIHGVRVMNRVHDCPVSSLLWSPLYFVERVQSNHRSLNTGTTSEVSTNRSSVKFARDGDPSCTGVLGAR